jgi:hypothetical protein
MSSPPERTVPTGAIAAALAMVESLHGRDGNLSAEQAAAELVDTIDRWGIGTIVEAFGILIYTVLHTAKPPPGATDHLHLLVPAVLTRFHRMQMREVPNEALPLVAGLLTAAYFDQDLYKWRTSLGPLRTSEPLVWCYTAWLLVDFMDEALFEEPGQFARLVREILIGHGPAEVD